MLLSSELLANLSAEHNYILPQYDRRQVTAGVVHLGPSHFARGHLFRYFDTILKTDSSWGVRAISLRSSSVRDSLQNQNYLYSVTERDSEKNKTRIIGSLIDVTVASENPKKALDILCDPNIKLVTLTVTQAGYGHNPTTGTLDFNREDIKECLSNMDEPSSAIGYLVSALEHRMNAGAPPLTIMSCDNIPANGTIMRNVVLAYAAQKSSDLRKYIEQNIRFPSTMVDRIVPRTTQKDIFQASANGSGDQWPIITEGFRQWVIEDSFAGEVPDFRAAGAIVTRNVEPFELMKLRMLNGTHMALGCIGRLAGYEYVDEAIADDQIADFVRGFMDEAATTVPSAEGIDLTAYKKQTGVRLRNPYMRDELSRLARNGTQKINGRILDTLKDIQASGLPFNHMAFATAAWIQYLKGYDSNNNEIDIVDENAVKSGLQSIARNSNGSPEPVIVASQLFDSSLTSDREFIETISKHLHNIQKFGVIGALDMINDGQPRASMRLVYTG